jgi:hypothetical protein
MILGPGSGSGYGSTDLIESGSETPTSTCLQESQPDLGFLLSLLPGDLTFPVANCDKKFFNSQVRI